MVKQYSGGGVTCGYKVGDDQIYDKAKDIDSGYMNPRPTLKRPHWTEKAIDFDVHAQFSDARIVEVDIDDKIERVFLDPTRGPLLYKSDGSISYKKLSMRTASSTYQAWDALCPTTREIALLQVARSNATMRRNAGRDIWKVARHAWGIFHLDQYEYDGS
eukprot:gnl/TRDRNA2_/TRDRNA2_43583_c0_seq2.p2 gnl/TRDRNA2_/TRDRNA2_43583_c0~~gnl/TRDRNA2_/TRDRNA2_43583_c0_seq2.p2  ORF type:complete len:160 (-),score=16.71 gnl/TRDRNA2_/TRDRNA2_43583_c0_seq2:94-573(-)